MVLTVGFDQQIDKTQKQILSDYFNQRVFIVIVLDILLQEQKTLMFEI